MSLAGILILTRHGDRQGFYQDPSKYTASKTNLTVLGGLQELQNGADLRSLYMTGDIAIEGLNTTIVQDSQIQVLADAGGEGEVIVDSANALLQGMFISMSCEFSLQSNLGLYPPAEESISLANGTSVTWNRTQLLQVQTIEANDQIWLEGWTSCNSWEARLK